MNQYFLQHDAGVKQIDAQSLATCCDDRNGAGGIAAQHVPAPLCCEVVGMDGENLRLSIANLYGIAGIAAIIYMERWQGADFYERICRLQVDVVFHERSLPLSLIHI